MSYPKTGEEVYVSLNLSNTMLTGIGKGTITREDVSADYLKRLFAVVGGIMEKLLVIQIQGQRLMDDGVIVADQDARCFAHGDHLRSNISLF